MKVNILSSANSLIFSLLFFLPSFSQHSFQAIVTNADTKVPLPGAIIAVNDLNGKLVAGGSSDLYGRTRIGGIPEGEFRITISLLGFISDTLKADFPRPLGRDTLWVNLQPKAFELEEFVVSSTRSGNYVEDTPLKVEVLGGDEVEEKSVMQPGNISMMLSEFTGIQAQQTSATSGNVSVKIQGLNGKYTQILKDGFPVYGGFSGELSLMQTPPLDLKQVEIIKGSASTLYGGDAIAGIINLISKEPNEKQDLNFILNQTTLDGTDFGSFFSKRNGKLGITLATSGTKQTATDVNDDFFTDLPEQERASIHPRLFFYFDDDSRLILSIYSGFETRTGGDIVAINDQPDLFHTFVEKNKSSRNYSTLQFNKTFHNGDVLTVKNSLNHFNRSIENSSYKFKGVQFSSYSEASYLLKLAKHDIVTGINVFNDIFTENKNLTIYDRDYTHFTVGGFVQDEWKATEKVSVQGGMRVDFQQQYGWYGLPQLSALFKLSDKFTARIGGGMGYKVPNLFTDEAEAVAYKNVTALPFSLKAETSMGGNADLLYRTRMGDNSSITINQSFFYTQIDQPLVLRADSLINGVISYTNANDNITTQGAETNLNLTIGEINLVAGYTFTDARRHFDTVNTIMPLTAPHRLALDFIWNQENNWKIGLEGFYTSKQQVSDHTSRPEYWTFGVLVQKTIKNYSFVINLENIFDERQTKHEAIVIPPVNSPTFREIWAPPYGFMANIALRISI